MPTPLAPAVSGLPPSFDARNSEAVKLWLKGEDWQSSQPLSPALGRAFGTEDNCIKEQTINQILKMVPRPTEGAHPSFNPDLNAALAIIEELAPRDAQDRSLAMEPLGRT